MDTYKQWVLQGGKADEIGTLTKISKLPSTKISIISSCLNQNNMLSKQINRLNANLEALRDFVNLVHTFLDEQKEAAVREHRPSFDPLRHSILRSVGDTFGEPPTDVATLPDDEELQRSLDNLGVQIECDVDKEEKKISVALKITKPSGEFLRAVKGLSKAEENINLLNNSSLLNLTSAVELFFAEIFHAYFGKHLESIIPSKENIFSLEDLEKFSTVDEARQHYINGKIEDNLRGSFSDWLKVLREKAHMSMSYLDEDMVLLVETFQRRNLIVHNGGVVNTIYIANVSKVSPKLIEGLKVGDKLNPDKEYLAERINLLEKCCILIGSEMWKNADAFDGKRGDLLNEITYKCLRTGRWDVAAALCTFQMRDAKQAEPIRLMAQLNYWLCKKQLGKWNEVSREAISADYSGKGLLYQIGLAALIDSKDVFFQLVPRVLGAKDINIHLLNEFPIFEEMRQDARFDQYRDVASLPDTVSQEIIGDSDVTQLPVPMQPEAP